MKTQYTVIVTLTAVLASCTPYPEPYHGGRNRWYSDFTEPAQEQKQYRKIPVGHPDPQGRGNMVLSPFRPYNIIDVTGYSRGDIVGDPSTALINPRTDKRDPKTAKTFRIP